MKEVLAKQACTEYSEHTARTVPLKGNSEKLGRKLDFTERHIHLTDLRYSLQVDACDFRKYRIVDGLVFIVEITQRCPNAFKNVDAKDS